MLDVHQIIGVHGRIRDGLKLDRLLVRDELCWWYRPGTAEFLEYCFGAFDVVIWTGLGDSEIVSILDHACAWCPNQLLSVVVDDSELMVELDHVSRPGETGASRAEVLVGPATASTI